MLNEMEGVWLTESIASFQIMLMGNNFVESFRVTWWTCTFDQVTLVVCKC